MLRYLRISGVLQRKGRGLVIVPSKHILAEKLAKSTASEESIMNEYKKLCNGAPLPTDDIVVAKSLLDDLMKQMKERHIVFDISEFPLTNAAEINIARQHLENILAQTDEIAYASEQCNQWKEIADYMSLLIKGAVRLFMMMIMLLKYQKTKHRHILNGYYGEQHLQLIMWKYYIDMVINEKVEELRS